MQPIIVKQAKVECDSHVHGAAARIRDIAQNLSLMKAKCKSLCIEERHLRNQRRKPKTPRHAAQTLHDPSLDPRNIEPKRLEKIFATLTVGDPKDIMEWEMTHHMEC